jgi:hypothetical protein
MLDGQAEPPPDRNPSCVAAKESGRRLARAALESMDAIKLGCGGLSVVEQPASLIGALNSPDDKSADERQSLETKPISRGTESSNPIPSSRESANFRFLSRRALTCLSAAQHYHADAHHGSFPLSGSDIGLQIPLGFMQVRSFRAAADNLGDNPRNRSRISALTRRTCSPHPSFPACPSRSPHHGCVRRQEVGRRT